MDSKGKEKNMKFIICAAAVITLGEMCETTDCNDCMFKISTGKKCLLKEGVNPSLLKDVFIKSI